MLNYITELILEKWKSREEKRSLDEHIKQVKKGLVPSSYGRALTELELLKEENERLKDELALYKLISFWFGLGYALIIIVLVVLNIQIVLS